MEICYSTVMQTSAKAVWTGVISFGVIKIPVKLYAAARDAGISFNQVHVCGSGQVTKINQQNYCTTCHTTVEYSALSKGFEKNKGEFVVIDPAELKALEPKVGDEANTINITSFVALAECDPIFFEKSYFIGVNTDAKVGGKANLKPYELFFQVMKGTGKAGVAKFYMRNKEYNVFVRAYGNGLVVHTLYAEAEVRDIPEFNAFRGDVQVSAGEVTFAKQLLEAQTVSFDTSTLADNYTLKVAALVEAKRTGTTYTPGEAPKPKTNDDLMEQLAASIKAANGGKTQTASN
jgi:DNA end-binding protein Ku